MERTCIPPKIPPGRKQHRIPPVWGYCMPQPKKNHHFVQQEFNKSFPQTPELKICFFLAGGVDNIWLAYCGHNASIQTQVPFNFALLDRGVVCPVRLHVQMQPLWTSEVPVLPGTLHGGCRVLGCGQHVQYAWVRYFHVQLCVVEE